MDTSKRIHFWNQVQGSKVVQGSGYDGQVIMSHVVQTATPAVAFAIGAKACIRGSSALVQNPPSHGSRIRASNHSVSSIRSRTPFTNQTTKYAKPAVPGSRGVSAIVEKTRRPGPVSITREGGEEFRTRATVADTSQCIWVYVAKWQTLLPGFYCAFSSTQMRRQATRGCTPPRNKLQTFFGHITPLDAWLRLMMSFVYVSATFKRHARTKLSIVVEERSRSAKLHAYGRNKCRNVLELYLTTGSPGEGLEGIYRMWRSEVPRPMTVHEAMQPQQKPDLFGRMNDEREAGGRSYRFTHGRTKQIRSP
ncbi:hypothetical protein AG1IA_05241 [Rhizoctonia solani AG-1 IA]|uniref:Uncharacterized protein n=1 Tax=Thanatephorus cucumeris (strain AG1-IA) TaxID=983506 RepID=L8WVA7_THACA|nr:hypothetical protein AG1IA_05241 [Rhizoctonia solani AG-1 IA]